jgi:phosphate transport system substrate-binding protein
MMPPFNPQLSSRTQSSSRPDRKEPTVRRHPARSTSVVGVLASLLLVLTAQSSQAVPHAKIEGSGSSWAANAVTQWIADVTSSGLQVVFTSQGSAQGRKDFANNTTDFAVSDIGFRGVDPATGDQDTNQGRAYAYLPIVAGGTSFPYNLSFGGKRITDLRLSGATLAKIFTNQITMWNDAAITADNNGRKLPAIAIVPLVHSEGSGSTAQLTTYFDTVYPSIWRPYQGRAGFTEYYPKKGASMIAQNGSDQIINYATSAAANGVITYDEYSYALAKNFPVAKVENANGYFTLPTQYNVAVALTKAQINTDKTSPNYLLQDLSGVYSHPDPRTYPLSSYSYMIIPTGASDPRMSTAKRQTLVDYLYYSVCTGQKEMGPIGYSPLPVNLVQASFDQVNKLKVADPAVDITQRDVSTCRNPTFVAGQPTRNYLAEIAPLPPACDKVGAGPCTGAANAAILANPTGGKAPALPAGAAAAAGGTAGGAAGGPGPTATGGPGSTAARGAAAAGAAVPKAGGAIDPATGQVLASGALGSGVDGSQSAVSTDLASASAMSKSVLTTLTIILLLLAIAMPPLIGSTLAKRKPVRR